MTEGRRTGVILAALLFAAASADNTQRLRRTSSSLANNEFDDVDENVWAELIDRTQILEEEEEELELAAAEAAASSESENEEPSGWLEEPHDDSSSDYYNYGLVDDREDAYHRSLYNKRTEVNLQRWWNLTHQVPTCVVGAAACSDGILQRLRYAVTAEAKMRHDGVLGSMGGYGVGWLGLLCAAAGIFLGWKKEEDFSGKSRGGGRRTKKSRDGGRYEQVQKLGSNEFEDDDVDTGSEEHFDSYTLGQGHEYRTAPLSSSASPPATLKAKIFAKLSQAKTNFETYWTATLTFVRPLSTFKAFLALLLVWELNGVMAPEQSMLATPELIAMVRAHPKTHDFVPHLVRWAMPDLDESTADYWVRNLKIKRGVLILCWFAYMLSPPPPSRGLPSVGTPVWKKVLYHPWFSGSLYAIGALIYMYLGAIGLIYNLAHSTQGGMLFIVAAIPAVPYLNTDPKAAAWLRKMLFASCLVPIYLFSGVSKIRYEGVVWNLNGHWLWAAFSPRHANRVVLAGVHNWVHEHKWTMAVMSWGNLFLELFLPWAMILGMDRSKKLRYLFHFTAVMFHVTIFLTLGPNFARYVLMHFLAMDPMSWFTAGGCCRRNSSASDPSAVTAKDGDGVNASNPTKLNKMDHVRIFTAMFSIAYWFKVQIHSDIDHLTGKSQPLERHNPYFPIPELSMFASPNVPTFTLALILCVFSIVLYVYSMVRTQKLEGDDRDSQVVVAAADETVASDEEEDLGTLDLEVEDAVVSAATGGGAPLGGTPAKNGNKEMWGSVGSPQSVMDVKSFGSSGH